MATYSFYLPKSEETRILRQLERLASEKGASLSELILEALKRYLDKQPTQKSAGWASIFQGSWGGTDALKTLKVIEKSRTRQKNPELK
jgi:hypothetical protein